MGPLDCSNEANFLDVDAYAYVTPFYDEENSIALHNDPTPKLPYELPGTINKFFVVPVPTLLDASHYLHHDPRGQQLLKQKPALATFLEGIEKQSFNVLPVYGYTIQETEQCEDCFPGNILQIITAARYTQLQLSAQDKGLIIPVFYDYKKESDLLMDTIIPQEDWGKYEKPGAANARQILQKLGLRSAKVFSVADISDPNTIQKIQTLQTGQILLLSMGPLPKVVFEGFYNHTGNNVWPQIREGANTFNSLVLTGKPHLRCGYWDIGYDLVKDPNLKKQLQNFYDKFCRGSKTWQENPNLYQTLGQFFIDANDPHSAFSNYFKFLKEEAFKPQNDRIHLSVEDILKRVN